MAKDCHSGIGVVDRMAGAGLFDPKLGGVVVKEGEDVKGFLYEIPKKFEPAMGKVAGQDAYPDWQEKVPD